MSGLPVTEPSPDGDGARYLVALLEIQGGLVGLWALVRDLAEAGLAAPRPLLVGAAGIGIVLVASVVAGVALWQDRTLGYRLSVPVQLAQVLWFAGADLTLRVSASGWLLADLFVRRSVEAGTVVGWQFDVARKGGYALSLAPRTDFTLALNLIALAILVWLTARLRGWRS